jgi:hypothetical protein
MNTEFLIQDSDAYLKKWEEIFVLVLENIPFLDEGWHEKVNVIRFVEMMPNRVSQGSDGIVQNKQVLVLVLAEGKDQRLQNETEVRNQLSAGFLLESGKSRACCLLHSFVAIQHSFKKLKNWR